ncbi:MAG: glycosyltransferase family 4 protein [Planctomycetia bacterium]|nr:glycosyltransferase family 4 protein [Planctomycetia bacterium]
MPRALLLCEYPALNGGERSLLAVLPTLQQAGWEFDAWCPGSGPIVEAFTAIGIRCIAQRPILDPRSSLEERRADLRSVLAAGPPYDLVHANSLAMGRLSGPVVEQAKVPSIAHLRDIVGLNHAAVADLNRHPRLLAVSEAVQRHHIGQGLAAEQTDVLYNGIDLARFHPATSTLYLQRELGLAATARLVGIVGQLILRKGQNIALAATIESMLMRNDVHVVVIGTRHSEKPETIAFERELHAAAARLGPAQRIHFLGTRTDMPRLFPELSLLVHTARQEPLGRVLLEASACGVPVVATDVGGTREIYQREERDGALFVPVGDVAATHSALDRILDDRALATKMSIAGRTRIVEAFSAERSAAGLLRHYTEVAGRRP